jgi:signal transduction histidine kinase
MSRRILASQLALTVVLLLGLCVPMGLEADRHDHVLFTLRTTAAMDAYCAEVKWRRLTPETAASPLPTDDPGDSVDEPDDLALYSPDGRLIASAGARIPVSTGEIASARKAQVLRQPSASTGHRLVVIEPITNTDGPVGVLAMARSDRVTRTEIRDRWIRLTASFCLAALAAIGLSLLLSRWVGRPLRRLDRMAAQFGSGDLSSRARAVGGPSEVRQLAASFDAMAGRIERLVDGQRGFLADVSHQIRTPLTAMRLRLELLAQDAEPMTAAEIGGTLTELHRLSRMVDGLLAMARAQGAPQARRRIEVALVVEERVAIWRPVAAAAEIVLLCDVDADLTAHLTPGHLEQVLDNLLSNALDAVAAGGRIEVRGTAARGTEVRGTDVCGTEVPGTEVRGTEVRGRTAAPARVTVADDGPGMTAAARARAFRRFQLEATESSTGRPAGGRSAAEPTASARAAGGRGGLATEVAPAPVRADRRGHGLGLAVVHALIDADGGAVSLGESDHGGLLVVLDLPVTAPPNQPTASG